MAVTDDGLWHITRLTDLESLWVCGRDGRDNKITDAGLKQIEGLTKLKTLGIQNTQVTRRGIQAFAAAVPACKIHQ